ncbi:MAG: SDR family oxidoreductase [Lewinella sp.]|uniref:SDR family oxidoreductase n=1 Tax=Lewinella sp. TaxID=2004506 RepID=UPI003D6BF8BA
MSQSTLAGKVAIVTGSSMGIGKAVAIALANKQVKVVLNGRNLEKLTRTTNELQAQGLEVFPIQGDVGIYEDCERLIAQTVAQYGALDILVNNAGLAMTGSIADAPADAFQKVFHTNILGVLYPTKAAIPHLKATKGSVVFSGSIAGFMGIPNYSAYSASKMSLTALVQSLKIELAGTGVHVGINYIGFAENDPTKTYLNEQGEVVTMPVRDQFKKMPVEEVAQYFVSGIEKRKYKQTLSLLGKLTGIMPRFFPRIFEWAMIRKHLKNG